MGITWSHPGHRYGLFEVDPLIFLTTKIPSSASSIESLATVRSDSSSIIEGLLLPFFLPLRLFTGVFSQSI
jgi:hypothetical protein